MLSKQHQLTNILCIVLFIISASCVTSLEQDVKLHPSLSEDKEYSSAYQSSSKKFEITKNFETKHIITITTLNRNFLDRFAVRYKRLFNESAPILNEASGKIGLFISLYSADSNSNQLENSAIWNIQLQYNNTILKPELIKKIKTKTEWSPFFPEVNPWTREYIVLFATKSLAENNQNHIIISNADTRIDYSL